MKGKKRLAINKCEIHGFFSISIEGDGSGIRVTPSKCCGKWSEVRSWKLSESEWTELSELAFEAANEVAVKP